MQGNLLTHVCLFITYIHTYNPIYVARKLCNKSEVGSSINYGLIFVKFRCM